MAGVAPTPRQPAAKEVDGMLHDLDTNCDGHIKMADNRWHSPIRNSARSALAEARVHDPSVAEASKKASEKRSAGRCDTTVSLHFRDQLG